MESHLFGDRRLVSAGKRFVMIELGFWREDDAVSVGAELKAEIDIVEGDSELLRKPPCFVECFAFRQDASCGYGAYFACARSRVVVALLVAIQAGIEVSRTRSLNVDSRMLNGFVPVVELCSDCAYGGFLTYSQH